MYLRACVYMHYVYVYILYAYIDLWDFEFAAAAAAPRPTLLCRRRNIIRCSLQIIWRPVINHIIYVGRVARYLVWDRELLARGGRVAGGGSSAYRSVCAFDWRSGRTTILLTRDCGRCTVRLTRVDDLTRKYIWKKIVQYTYAVLFYGRKFWIALPMTTMLIFLYLRYRANSVHIVPI